MTKFRNTAPVSLPRRAALAVLASAAAVLLTGAGSPSSQVSRTEMGATVIGNPAAKVRLVEYLSYTCSHCGDFANNSSSQMMTQYVNTGRVKVEFRNLARDPFDMTAALLARCGTVTAFYGNHQAIFAAQPTWTAKMKNATEAQQQRWAEGTPQDRMKKIAVDSGLFALMKKRGYSDVQLNACLASETSIRNIMAMTNEGRTKDNVRGTPTFFINGQQIGSPLWSVVRSALDEALKAA